MSWGFVSGMLVALTLSAGETVVRRKEDTTLSREFEKRLGEYLKLPNSPIKGIPDLTPKAHP